MAASRAEHEVSPSGAGPPSLGGSPVVSDLSFSPEGDNIVTRLTGQTENGTAEAAGRVEPTTGAAHTPSSSRRTTPTVTSADEDDAGSSVSETTAVETGRRADFGTQTQARARELEDQISRFCADSANRITLVGLCSDLRADAAVERGAALALQGQLVEARREIAGLQRQALVAERPLVGDVLAGRAAAAAHGPSGVHGPETGVPLGAPPTLPGPAGGVSYAAVLRPGPTTGGQVLGRPGFPGMAAAPGGATTMATRHNHVAFLTPTGTTEAPARDVVRVLKANINPVAKDIRDVTLGYTRWWYWNRHLNERNPSLQLDMERAKVRVTFRERGGTKAFVVEVDPPAFHRIMACPRLSIGWTIVRAYEDLHVSTCTYCASYGHSRSSWPVAGDPSKKVCMRCGAEGHLGAHCAALEDVVARYRSPNIVLAGDLNAKHLAWGLRAGDERGARVVEFAAAAGLVFLNDPASEPTYETANAASWIDVTLATPSALAAGYTWKVRLDETFSEHKFIEIHIGDTRNEPRKRLTRYAQSELLGTLARETWFTRVTQSQPASSEALEYVLAKFYRTSNHHLKRHLRPAKARTGGNSWWTPDLALERKRVNATRRRFQRCSDPLLRPVLRQNYTASLERFRMNVQAAKHNYEAECHSACSRDNVFSRSYREAFGKTRSPRYLPPLERADGTLTSTHLESAALLLETQIAVDSPVSDKSCHAATRKLVTAPCDSPVQDVPFTETEVADVLNHMPPRSSPGPDSITPSLMRGLFRFNTVMLPDTHPRIGELFGWSHPVGHMRVSSLTSVASFRALSWSAGTHPQSKPHRDAVPRVIRSPLRKWLALPQDTPLRFYYAAVEDGGLGVPCLRTTIPAMRAKRSAPQGHQRERTEDLASASSQGDITAISLSDSSPANQSSISSPVPHTSSEEQEVLMNVGALNGAAPTLPHAKDESNAPP
ncbi:hypothetical protein HPB52_023719 [Rhipicephalus sanguineus]|uniref:CCHC-type domain-containing protein n=1 Tax=Rhipicephalus sanguineus TaxID=34632 RepID=A0A9D4Q3S9_RHISA|nr:hypothetical protein HPB52_023719 [Rhipicephalus sanguineus]